MEASLSAEIATFNILSPERVILLPQSESRHLELTKSLLNLLHNIVIVESVEASDNQKIVIDYHEPIIWKLLDDTTNLTAKKRLFERNVDLVQALAESCPI